MLFIRYLSVFKVLSTVFIKRQLFRITSAVFLITFTFIFLTVFGNARSHVHAADLFCATVVSGVCGGEVNPFNNETSPCPTGYICSCPGMTCTCVPDEAACGLPDPDLVLCGDPGTVGECGLAGGCGPHPLVCTQTGTNSYQCYLSYTNPKCGCVLGVTCPSDAECTVDGDCDYDVDGAILNPDTGDSESIFEILQYEGPIIDNLPALLSPIFKLLFYVGIFIGILGIIYSGYLLMVSEGDPGRAKEGKEQFTAAILGSLFILLSVVILRAIINSILGVNSGL